MTMGLLSVSQMQDYYKLSLFTLFTCSIRDIVWFTEKLEMFVHIAENTCQGRQRKSFRSALSIRHRARASGERTHEESSESGEWRTTVSWLDEELVALLAQWLMKKQPPRTTLRRWIMKEDLLIKVDSRIMSGLQTAMSSRKRNHRKRLTGPNLRS